MKLSPDLEKKSHVTGHHKAGAVAMSDHSCTISSQYIKPHKTKSGQKEGED